MKYKMADSNSALPTIPATCMGIVRRVLHGEFRKHSEISY